MRAKLKCNRAAMEGPGEFCFTEGETHCVLWLPSGSIVGLRVSRDGPQSGGPVPVWGWDGNREAPTLAPSIHLVGEWHGYLQAGFLSSC